ncbi:MAG: protein phosphatase CheZ [Rhodospirillales bacterium]|jgi:chemotaxis protein CheZ
MAGTPTKKLFSAEIKMMKEKGQELPQHVFERPDAEAIPQQTVNGVSNAQLLSAILDLQIIMRKNAQAAAETPQPAEAPKDLSEQEQPEQDSEAASAMKNELRALSRSIQETKAEIRSMQGGTQGGDQVLKASTELDAVVQATEDATNVILESTEKIDELAEKLQLSTETAEDRQAADEIMELTLKMVEACNFQDLTGQRITKVVNALKYVEDRINAMIEIWGEDDIAEIEASVADETDEDKNLLNGPALSGEGIGQDDIDALFD